MGDGGRIDRRPGSRWAMEGGLTAASYMLGGGGGATDSDQSRQSSVVDIQTLNGMHDVGAQQHFSLTGRQMRRHGLRKRPPRPHSGLQQPAHGAGPGRRGSSPRPSVEQPSKPAPAAGPKPRLGRVQDLQAEPPQPAGALVRPVPE